MGVTVVEWKEPHFLIRTSTPSTAAPQPKVKNPPDHAEQKWGRIRKEKDAVLFARRESVKDDFRDFCLQQLHDQPNAQISFFPSPLFALFNLNFSISSLFRLSITARLSTQSRNVRIYVFADVEKESHSSQSWKYIHTLA